MRVNSDEFFFRSGQTVPQAGDLDFELGLALLQLLRIQPSRTIQGEHGSPTGAFISPPQNRTRHYMEITP